MKTENMTKILIEIPDKEFFRSLGEKVKDKIINRLMANIEPVVIVNRVLYIDISDNVKSDENKLISFRKYFKQYKIEVYRLIQREMGFIGMKNVKEVDLDNLRFLYSLHKKFGGDLFIENLKGK